MSKNHSKNKATLIMTLATIGIIALAIIFVLFSDLIPPSVIIIALLLLEVFVAVPSLNICYYKLYNSEMGYKKVLSFIPYLNYTVSMNPVMEKLCHGVFIVLLLSSVSILFPDIYSLFGDLVVLQVDQVLPIVQFILFMVLNVLIGIGLYLVTSDIQKLYRKAFPSEQTSKGYKIIDSVFRALPFVEVILLILPIIRVIPLLTVTEKAQSLLKLNLNVRNVFEEDL